MLEGRSPGDPDGRPPRRKRRARPKDLEDLSPEEIRQIFRPDDRFFTLAHAHTPVHRIALYFHAAVLDACGRQAPFEPIPPRIVAHLAGILGISVPEPFVYPDLQITFLKHAEKVRRVLGWQKCTQTVQRSFESWLAEEARRSIDPFPTNEEAWSDEVMISCSRCGEKNHQRSSATLRQYLYPRGGQTMENLVHLVGVLTVLVGNVQVATQHSHPFLPSVIQCWGSHGTRLGGLEDNNCQYLQRGKHHDGKGGRGKGDRKKVDRRRKGGDRANRGNTWRRDGDQEDQGWRGNRGRWGGDDQGDDDQGEDNQD